MTPRNTIQKLPNGKSPMLPLTCNFNIKLPPDGYPLKFNPRYCVQGDKQTEGVDYFETYTPVVSWCTVRLDLALILSNGCHTKQVPYTNSFVISDPK